MEEIFVTKLRINKVRHLENLEIPLSETERKHLILTGKNGSGKTSVLEGVNVFLNWVLSKPNDEDEIIDRKVSEYFLLKLKQKELYDIINEADYNEHNFQRDYTHINNMKLRMNSILSVINDKVPIKLILNTGFNFNSIEFYDILWLNGDFIIKYFPSKRIFNPKESRGPQKIEQKKNHPINENLGENFVRQLVNLRMDLLDAKDTGRVSEVAKVKTWFERFESILKDIYDDETLTLEFDRPNFNYLIKIKEREPFSLNQLSDGYGAILSIITELTMRMDSKYAEYKFAFDKPYDLQGIVLIDEIETHLHIDLQKKILPFLTSFFPKIQFIVTTHSPFVLSSVDNAVIYDLEKQQVVEDLSDYSYQELVETYFGTDQYSDVVKQKLNEYELLIKKQGRTEEEEDKLYEIRRYFRKLPFFLSQELQLKIQELELYKLPEQAI
ncbi:AAA family ATPase [Runella aurantiaca]|nr:AAA family ATPase [Runella aurantiaca]